MVYLDDLAGVNAALIGATSFSIPATLEVELPQSVVLGYSFKPNEKWTLNFDVEWMDWSSIEQDRLVYKDNITTNQGMVLNNGNPAARDWNGAMSAGIGGEYKWSGRLRLRSGYFYHDSVIPNANFQSSLPDARSHSLTAGFGSSFFLPNNAILINNSNAKLVYKSFYFNHYRVILINCKEFRIFDVE